MKKLIYSLYILWAILSIAYFFWKGNVAIATAFIWIPIALVVSASFLITLIGDIGERIKRRRRENAPRDCTTCLFGQTADLVNKTKKEGEEVPCVGESMGYKRGVTCPHWSGK